MATLGSTPRSFGPHAHPAVSVLLALTVGVLAVAGVRHATSPDQGLEPRRPADAASQQHPTRAVLARRWLGAP